MAKSISHNGPNSPNLPEYDPIALYNRVFGAGFSTGTTTNVADVTLATRKSVLDLVAADTKALEARLGATDKARLDQHLQGVIELEKQLVGMPVMTAGCTAPTKPAGSYPRHRQRADSVGAAFRRADRSAGVRARL